MNPSFLSEERMENSLLLLCWIDDRFFLGSRRSYSFGTVSPFPFAFGSRAIIFLLGVLLKIKKSSGPFPKEDFQ